MNNGLSIDDWIAIGGVFVTIGIAVLGFYASHVTIKNDLEAHKTATGKEFANQKEQILEIKDRQLKTDDALMILPRLDENVKHILEALDLFKPRRNNRTGA